MNMCGVFGRVAQGACVAAGQHSAEVRRAAERWLTEGCPVHAALDSEPRASACDGLGEQLLPNRYFRSGTQHIA